VNNGPALRDLRRYAAPVGNLLARYQAHRKRGVMRGLFSFVLGLLLISGCGASSEVESLAILTVIPDLVSRAPTEIRPFLSPAWATSGVELDDPLQADLIKALSEASGLEVASQDQFSSADSTLAILYFMKPRVDDVRAVVVVGGWMRLTGGTGGGAWGWEYVYRLDCSEECMVSGPPGGEVWN
jgi:hypothetical protein